MFYNMIRLEQLKLKIYQSLGVASHDQLLVHQVDGHHSPVNVSLLEEHQFQQHIISLRPDHVSIVKMC